MTPQGTLSVVVLNWNGRSDLADCLRSLERQEDREIEVVVVDNGSSDGSPEMVERDFPSATLVRNGANLGFAEGCNRGIEASHGEWVAMLNNDAVAHPRWAAELRAAVLGGGPRLGLLQSRILFKQKPDRTNSTGILLFEDGRARDRDFDVPAREEDAIEAIFCPTAGAALYRRAMLEEVRLPSGYFDRGFFIYTEDLDLGWRCRLAGWEAIYVPRSTVYHAMHASLSQRGRSARRFVEGQCAKNRVRCLVKNGSARFIASTLPRTGYDLLRLAYWLGPRALPELVSAVGDAASQRGIVSRLARVDRRAVEQRWVVNRREAEERERLRSGR
jgi:GT2 family glycosyltransferase